MKKLILVVDGGAACRDAMRTCLQSGGGNHAGPGQLMC
jgi:hypothetical protein